MNVSMPAVIVRALRRDEIELLWTIDRSETIDGLYHLENGRLILESRHFEGRGWPPGEAEKYTPLLHACYDRGGVFFGAFDGHTLAGMTALDTEWLGAGHNLLQLKMLHVGRAYRGRGLGVRLFQMAAAAARERGARGLYISATPSRHTIEFYRRLGAEVTDAPDAALYALEPEDIHMVYLIG